jgi:carbon storage regulator
MLVLSRRIGEEVVIAGNIRVQVISVQGDRVRLSIEAPESVRVDRREVHERRLQDEPRTRPPFLFVGDPTRPS